MPISKRRKNKKGKAVKHNPYKEPAGLADRESAVSLQDLINVVAYQETHPVEAVGPLVHIPDSVPVVVGEGDDKREVGKASPIDGDTEHVSIHITDPGALKLVQDPDGHYSIDKEIADGRQ